MFAALASRRLAFLLALCGPLAACGKDKVTEVEAPAAATPMRYDLTPGGNYEGAVKVRNQLETPLGPLTLRFEFDVKMHVTGNSGPKGALFSATPSNIQVRVIAPDALPEAMIPVTQEVADQLNGAEIRFRVDAQGTISDEPDLEGQPPQIQIVLAQVVRGILGGFVRLPDDALDKGGTWDASPAQGEGLVKGTGSGSFDRLVRIEGVDENLAQLEIKIDAQYERQIQGKMMESTSRETIELLFAAESGYTAKSKRVYSGTGGGGSLSGESEVTWTKVASIAVEASEPQVQEISDPCDPDYVGGEACEEEDPAAAAAKAAGDAAEAAATEAVADGAKAAAEAPSRNDEG